MADNAIARSLRDQAAKMELEAKGLLAESQRLQKEASDLDGVKPKKTTKNTVAVIPETPVNKRGRPAKASVTA